MLSNVSLHYRLATFAIASAPALIYMTDMAEVGSAPERKYHSV